MRNDVVNNVSPRKCTGCFACYNICPSNAISMKEKADGFVYPILDSLKCTNCGLCLKKCPVVHPKYINRKSPECRAIWAKDEIRMSAASGGIFSAFSEVILKTGGVVCGAAYEDDLSVSHICIDKLDDLPKIKSSKYVQSNANNVYQEIKRYMDSGKKVLFSGCPCQVAALYSYLGEYEVDNLYTMDIICHGVPSPKVFRKYLAETYSNEKIKKVDFRAKEYFGWSTEMTVITETGKVYRTKHDQDTYYRAFLPCLSLRESCGNCLFSRLPRQGDLTIGDFWGISRYKKELNDKKGTSLVLINNSRGEEIIRKCKKLWDKNEIVPIEQGLVINKTIERPFKAHPARKRFFENLDKYSLKSLVDNCLSHHYDVGIVGLWYGLNYGSILTYYALNRVISDLGYQCLMINKPKDLWNERYEDRNSIANKFIYDNCYVSNIRKSRYGWTELNDHCETFVLGSDVVWNYSVCGKEVGHFFYLDFVKNSKKKIAYASSFGGGFSENVEYEMLSKYYLDKFDYISVRENEAVELFHDRYNINVEQVVDPVFMCNKNYYINLINHSKFSENKKILVSYFLGPNISKKNLIIEACNYFKIEYRNLYNPNEKIEITEERLGLPLLRDISVEDWLYYMANCDFFVGDSFHGLCFSLIFEKPFMIMIDKNLPSRDRFDSLLHKIGLEERLVYLDTDIEKIKSIFRKEINYGTIRDKLKQYSKESKEWLEVALRSKKRRFYKVEDYVLENLKLRIEKLEEQSEHKE